MKGETCKLTYGDLVSFLSFLSLPGVVLGFRRWIEHSIGLNYTYVALKELDNIRAFGRGGGCGCDHTVCVVTQ